MKRVLLINQSLVLKNAYNYIDSDEIQPKNQILSPSGEELAKKLAEKDYTKRIDKIYASTYISAISTAKYIAKNNNIKINITSSLDEHILGNLGNLTKKEAENMQIKDFNFKLNHGCSINETKSRISTFLKQILNQKDENIVFVSHSNLIIILLLNWVKLGYNYELEPILSFNGEIIHDGKMEEPEVFELIFDNNKNIKSIKCL